MKKIKFFALSIIVCLIMCVGILLTGCSPSETKAGTEYKVGNITLEKIVHSQHFDLYVEKNTGIVYIFSTESYGSGVSVLYNKDGQPMTYDEYVKLQNN